MSNVNAEIDRLNSTLRAEADLHWQRNNYFLVVASILLLALSQFHNGSLETLVSGLGLAVSLAWLLIVHRSDRYIIHWKVRIRELEGKKNGIYPEKLSGIEMRKVAYILPLAFIALWMAVLWLLAANNFKLPTV
ncbi:MAG: hypothetical protein WB643_07630 [Candidatus Bathyarchaeia archaeon]